MLREDKGDMSPTTAFRSLSVRASASPPPPLNNALDDIFGDPAAPAPLPIVPATTSSQLDDIFGCSPPHDGAPHTVARGEEDGAAPHGRTAPSRDVSDIPRLRSVHVTAGYREGLAESKAGYVQHGFDEGFPLGAVLGVKVGWVLGVLEGVAVALRAAALRRVGGGAGGVDGAAAGAFEGVRKQLVEAREELDVVSLFGQEYFDGEGIWRYHVEGKEDEVTFKEVAAQHPLVSKWLAAVEALAGKERIDLGILDRRAREDSDDEETTVG
ncbi:Essential protein Yae1, N terminal [Neofusicoccum ribis]|uniref:Protein YAE1 n=1 Tax=Neofusicoccum ribis TaxID=45134 RepID=A0ABR3T4N7_9PEZI